jgi:hypothetical protein
VFCIDFKEQFGTSLSGTLTNKECERRRNGKIWVGSHVNGLTG